MPRTADMRESKFLKKTDVGRGVLVTIAACIQRDTARRGAAPEMKWCLTFDEIAKPLVLNATNIAACEAIFGSDNTDDWRGKRLVLFVDPAVAFGGQAVGGIRVRAPKPTAPAPLPPVATRPDLTADDIPF